jgi:hypothetical protein
MIRARTDLALPASLLSARSTPPLPRAADVLDRLKLW